VVAFDDCYARRMVSGELIVDGAITAVKIAANAVTADAIAAGSIMVSQFVGPPSQLVPNGGFEFGTPATIPQNFAGWNGGGNKALNAATAYSGVQCLQVQLPAGGTAYFVCDSVPVEVGRRIGIKLKARGWSSNPDATAVVTPDILWYKQDGTFLGSSPGTGLAVGNSNTWLVGGLNVSTVPAGAVKARFGVAFSATLGSSNAWVDDIEAYYVDDDVSHAAGNVVIDSTGITISNGKLTLQDEFGKTTMVASGFSGSWTDFIRLGLYNARFTDLTVGTLAVGRTAALPYWTLDQTVGAPVFTGLSGGGVKITFAALSDLAGMSSDKVPVRPGSAMQVGYSYKVNRAAGTLVIRGYVYWYKADGSSSATPYEVFSQQTLTASVSALTWLTNAVLVPDDAVQANLLLTVEETVSHNAANYVSFYATELIDAPVNIATSWKFGDSATAYETPGSGTIHNYDPGAIDDIVIYQVNPSGNLILTGLIAPTLNWRVIVLFNYAAAYTITLKSENANSNAANRFNLPGGVDLVIRAGGAVFLFYNYANSRWFAVAI
jgi:hypothetical protein